MAEGPPIPGRGRVGELFRLAAIVYLVLALGGLVWIGWREGTIPWRLFVSTTGWGLDLALGLATGLLLVGAWELLRRASPLATRLEARLADALGPLRADEALGLALLSGLAEEVFFRGAMQPSWGWLATTLLFGALHSGKGREQLLWTASALVAGGVLGGLVLWRGNLLAPVLAHVTVNAVGLRRLSRTAGEEGRRQGPPS